MRQGIREANVLRLIRAEMKVCDKSVERLATDTGIGVATIYRRFRSPDTMTIGEYMKLCRSLGVPIDEARGALRY